MSKKPKPEIYYDLWALKGFLSEKEHEALCEYFRGDYNNGELITLQLDEFELPDEDNFESFSDEPSEFYEAIEKLKGLVGKENEISIYYWW